MVDEDFFEASLEQSGVKTRIVAKYVRTWATVLLSRRNVDKVGYLDLFAGPGSYDDGTQSTPLVVLDRAIRDARLRDHLMTGFNDRNPASAKRLTAAIAALPNVQTLRYPPVVTCSTVAADLAHSFARMRLIPTLVFLDPWGYKGLSRDLIDAVIKDWGTSASSSIIAASTRP